jgi:hypothetical protein
VTQRVGSAAPQAREDLGERADGLIRQARLLNLSMDELQNLIGKHWGKKL